MFYGVCSGILVLCAVLCFIFRGSQGAGLGFGIAYLSLLVGMTTTIATLVAFSCQLVDTQTPFGKYLGLGLLFVVGAVVGWVSRKMVR